MRFRLLNQLMFGLVSLAVMTSVIETDAESTGTSPKKQVLFICTGNYYRSRFAEALFNEKAIQAGLGWRAVSRGLRLASSQRGISSFAKEELTKRGVPPELCRGEPQALTAADLKKSDYVICMNEAEHRPMLEKQFPERDERKIHYWHVAETDQAHIPNACAGMTAEIGKLLDMLERFPK